MKRHAELEQENHQIRQTLLMQEADYEAQLKAKDNNIEQLQQALMLSRNARFAASSEALRTLQLVLFNEAELNQAQSDDDTETDAGADEGTETVTIPAHKRKRGGRKPLSEELPRIEVIHTLAKKIKSAHMMGMRSSSLVTRYRSN
ncbi:MAG: hypothetical protein ACI9J2_000471 [Saprospiraceae bacterium]|jgi:hypothetical protein